MKSLFLSYTDADGVAPFFQLLEDQAGYNLVVGTAGILGRVVTKIQSEGTGTDPILEIVAVTDQRIAQSEASEIIQGAINWLMDNGHLERK